ncbi:hypothetical protein NDU88_010991 [Pleurodeles waltl]|uniref:Uncharacterized protein n=1 Tax=Pleurodeles waltl TaxID=8319 RepID=A0AAV7S436_PLEWA|nr:hypothetical protein NDU88_010991 [Pleurodeles waltl]
METRSLSSVFNVDDYALLGLIIAKRSIAIHWLSPRAPTGKAWGGDTAEWAGAEEEHLRRTRNDAKAQDVLRAWAEMTRTLLENGGSWEEGTPSQQATGD